MSASYKLLALLMLLSILFSACSPSIDYCNSETKVYNNIYQYSTYPDLDKGNYSGFVSVDSLKASGDFGIGTLDHINGELIVLEGDVFQVLVTGEVVTPPDSALSPFATVCFFEGDNQFVSKMQIRTYDSLKIMLDNYTNSKTQPVAFRIDGFYNSITLRSVPAQSKPYPVLSNVITQQKVFNHSNISGTMVGYWFPSNYSNIQAVGYHFHFISDDETIGGHVLNCSVETFSGEADYMDSVTVIGSTIQ